MKATVIVGTEGQGATTKAEKIASEIGAHTTANYWSLMGRFGLAAVLSGSPDCVIVEDSPISVLSDPAIKALITSRTVRVERKHQDPVIMKSPKKWIFIITGDCRRFDIVSAPQSS